MFLAVTPIEEFWDKGDELLFIGPWCALHDRRAAWSGLRHRFLTDPWRDFERYKTAMVYCRDLSSRMLDGLALHLNKAHATSHDRRYWRLLLDPWLTFHVEQLYDHFILVEEAFKLEPGLRTVVLDPSSWETPRDTADFVRLKIGDRFQLQLFSHVLSARADFPKRALAAAGAAERPLPGSVADPATRTGLKALVKRTAGPALRALGALGAGRVMISELGLTRDEQLSLVARSGLRALPFYGELPDSARPAPVLDERRRSLASLPARDAFEKLFVAGLPAHLPTIFLEGYAEAVRATLEALPRIPKVVFSSLGWHYADAFKFAAAESAARGAKLWSIQHGGSYGMDEFATLERLERDVCDRYYAWGWSKTDSDPRLKDLPSPLLSRGSAGPFTPGDDLLYLSTSLDFHNIRLIRDSNGAGAFDTLDRQARFLKALPEPARSKASMRLYRHDWGWSHRERLLELVPEARFDDSNVPFARRMREARLVVVETPSTPMLEALAADIPVLMTWKPDTWTIRPSARPYFDAFRKAGMLFDSAEDAAAEAGRAYADPRAWWDEPARRAARLEFTRTFALSDPDWIGAWAKEIRAGLET